ncbi:FxsA family protein [Nocardiopsis ansamitocini]|uniref:Uncharacterized protein n=1 Tax=Nocardiopsis ansamitocini TaxID=1670832 RepID=A0A9W6UK82_9ACTN|nr:FxsA family protein [Nocardiopsis ansamitocini]GLU48815.1 hypothetical protein Nans01_31660 [Nocardiopsis ansamitocini]
MPLLFVIALMALPFLEIWVMILVGQQIGVSWTIALLCALTVSGVLVVRRAGRSAYRDVEKAMRTGVQPKDTPLDMLMLLVGGILLVTPGFITAVLGALLVLPVTRPVLRWAFTGWAARRLERMRVRMEADLATLGDAAPGNAPGSGGPKRTPGGGQVIQGHIVTDDEQGRS